MNKNLTHFENLNFEKKNREIDLYNLLCNIFNSNFELSIVSQVKNKNIEYIAKQSNMYLYCAQNNNQIKDIASLLNSISFWHYSNFAIIAGSTGLTNSLKKINFCLSIPEIQANIEINISGYMFPVDDELICYGSQEFQDIFIEL